MPILAKELFALQISASKLAEVQAALGAVPGDVDAALAAAINKVLAKGKTAVKRGLTGLLTIRAANLEKRIYVSKANPKRLGGNVKIMGRPFGLVNFAVRDTRTRRRRGKGVVGKVYRAGPTIQLPHAFIATGKHGNEHVWQRTGPRRFPIEVIRSRSLFDLFMESRLPAEVTAGMQEDLAGQVDSQINRFLAER